VAVVWGRVEGVFWGKVRGSLYTYIVRDRDRHRAREREKEKGTFVRLIRISLYASTDSPILAAPESTHFGGLLHVY